MRWFIGCSGFSYKEWKPVFYPDGLPASRWLGYYCRHFNTLESNTTFYHTPRLTTLQKWFNETPEAFIFSVKAPRLVTHYKKMNDTHDILNAFYDLVLNGLQHKLGPILFQFPPIFSYTDERLSAILTQLDPAFTNVVEFRHQSWWQPAIYEKLAEAGISFCSISHPGLPDEVVITSPVLYFRFHGVPELYRSSYSEAYIDQIMHEMGKAKNAKAVFVYFNNTIAATAIGNAEYMQQKLLFAAD